MKRRAFVAGAAAVAGLSAMPWRLALAGHLDEGTPKYGGPLRAEKSGESGCISDW